MKEKRTSREAITGVGKKVFAVVLALLFMASGPMPAIGYVAAEYECLCEEHWLCLEEEDEENASPAGDYLTPVPFGTSIRHVYVINDGSLTPLDIFDPGRWNDFSPPQTPTPMDPLEWGPNAYRVYAEARYGYSSIVWEITGNASLHIDQVTTNNRQTPTWHDIPYYQTTILTDGGPEPIVIIVFTRLNIDTATTIVDFEARIIGYSLPTPIPVTFNNSSFMPSGFAIPSVDINEPFGNRPPQFAVDDPVANFNAIFQLTSNAFHFSTTPPPGSSGPHPVDISQSSPNVTVSIGAESGLGIGIHNDLVVVRHGPEPVSGQVPVTFRVMRPVTAIDLESLVIANTSEITVVTNRSYNSSTSSYDIISQTTLSGIASYTNIANDRIEVSIQRPCINTFFDQSLYIALAHRDNDNNFTLGTIYITPPAGFIEVSRSPGPNGSILVVFEPDASSPPFIPQPPSTQTPELEQTPPPTITLRPTPTPSPTPAPAEPITGTHHAFIIGFDDGLIRPNNTMTRAQAATVFFRLMSDEAREQFWLKENHFTDVSERRWFNNAISTTTNAGIFTELPNTPFRPNEPITRAEFAMAAARFLGISPAHGVPAFSDISESHAEAYINAIALEGWAMGTEGLGGRFRPNGHITRAEVAALINRALGRRPYGPEALLPDMIRWPDNNNINAWYYLYIQEASNSHHFIMDEDGIYETWEELIESRRWYLLERPCSKPEDINQ